MVTEEGERDDNTVTEMGEMPSSSHCPRELRLGAVERGSENAVAKQEQK